jgi:hypothetical protein
VSIQPFRIKLRLAVERRGLRVVEAGATDGMAATYIESQSPGDAADPVNLTFSNSESLINIAHFHELYFASLVAFPLYSSPRI